MQNSQTKSQHLYLIQKPQLLGQNNQKTQPNYAFKILKKIPDIRILFPHIFQVTNPRNIKGKEFKFTIDNI